MKLLFLLPAVASAWVANPLVGRGQATALKAADEFCVGVLGDLHIDPRKMEDYETGRSQWVPILEGAKQGHGNVALVSLGDLGESKSVRPEETSELFAGTTDCHLLAAEFLGSFGVPYEVIGGNHDLEGTHTHPLSLLLSFTRNTHITLLVVHND